MNLYLSSFKIGQDPRKLQNLLPKNPKAIYISNALDFSKPDIQKHHQEWDMRELSEIGVQVEALDLRDFFGHSEALKHALDDVDLIYVSGGNVYDLRLAMKLSGFDETLKEFVKSDKVYAGYSAAVCVLSPTLKGYHFVDKPDQKTYGDHETVWEGLNLIDCQFAPHFDSDHPESETINEEINYFQEHGMKYKALKDGKVIFVEIN